VPVEKAGAEMSAKAIGGRRAGRDGAGPAAREMRGVDLGHLRRQCLDDEALAAELLSRFRVEARAAARRLVAGDRLSAPAGADVAHRLRGAALGVGAFAVARAAEAVEARARAAAGSDAAEALAMAAAVVRLCEAVVQATAEIDGLSR
jgi:hypothetical protein